MTEQLAIHGGAPVRGAPWPAWPQPDADTAAAAAEVINSGAWFRVDGTQVSSFETRFAAFQGARFCTLVPNGTLALDAALRAAGVGVGDEVIVPPYTFIATAMAVIYVGAVPVFADIDPQTLVMDAGAAKAGLSERTKAIVPVHLAGRPADMDELVPLAQSNGIALIEDAAQAHGAEWRGRRVGALADLGMFSFQNSKNISAGEGGAIVTNDEGLADLVYSLCNVGRVRGGGWYEHQQLGYNLRMTELQGAVLHKQLDRHDQRQTVRERNARLLTELLTETDDVQLPAEDDRITAHGRHGFLIRLPAIAGKQSEVAKALAAEGILMASSLGGLHRNEALVAAARRNAGYAGADYQPAPCPATDRVTADTVGLAPPVLLADEQGVHDVVCAVRKVLAHLDEL